jgi:hypothetical protein
MDLRYGEHGSALFQRRGLRRFPPRTGEPESLGARRPRCCARIRWGDRAMSRTCGCGRNGP